MSEWWNTLTVNVPCHQLPAVNAPVAGNYIVGVDHSPGQLFRVRPNVCHVVGPDDIPQPQNAVDVDALVKVITGRYLGHDDEYRGMAQAPDEPNPLPGSPAQPGPRIPREMVLGLYLRALAKSATDPWSSTASRIPDAIMPVVTVAFANPGSEEVVVGLSELVKALRSRSVDAFALPWLWLWATGGPPKAPAPGSDKVIGTLNYAQPRTRVFAMQTLEALIADDRVPVNAATVGALDKLRQSFDDLDRMWPTFSDDEKQERALSVSQANSLIATAAQKLAEHGLDASVLPPLIPPPPPPATFPWKLVLGAGAGAMGLIITALLVSDAKRKRGSKARPRVGTRSRPRSAFART